MIEVLYSDHERCTFIPKVLLFKEIRKLTGLIFQHETNVFHSQNIHGLRGMWKRGNKTQTGKQMLTANQMFDPTEFMPSCIQELA